jgi:hypothetical protein
MRRIPWHALVALLAGFGLGLVYSWIISPLRVVDTNPAALRADFKDSYRAAVAAAYAATNNLPRAQARLSLLNDSNSVEALNAQAQRMLANSGSSQQADQVAALALALEGDTETVPTAEPSTEVVSSIKITPSLTLPPLPSDSPIMLTETVLPPESGETQPAQEASTPRPTRTAVPTLVEPFKLTGQEDVCDPNLPDGLLQVIVLNSNRRQMPGVKILITWDGGEEQFFTGLKPEVGNGYADYIMKPNTTYTLQLAIGSDIATGITVPTCQTETGEPFSGGIKLTFQQP